MGVLCVLIKLTGPWNTGSRDLRCESFTRPRAAKQKEGELELTARSFHILCRTQIAPDGHCLYAAIADQLWILRIIKEEEVRLSLLLTLGSPSLPELAPTVS